MTEQTIENLWLHYRCWETPFWASDTYQVRFGDKSWWYNVPVGTESKTSEEIRDHSIKWLKNRAQMKEATRFYDAFQQFSHAISDERSVCSAFLYNEYLAEERSESFGQFIEREKSELRERLWGYHWRYHELTERVLRAHAKSERPPFLYYSNLGSSPTKELQPTLRKRLGELRREEMEIIFDPNNEFPSVSVEGSAQILSDLIEKYRGSAKPLATRFTVERALFKLFARAVLESNFTETSQIALMSEKVSSLIPRITQQVTYDAVELQDHGMFPTNELLDFVKNLEPLAAELGPQRIAIILKLMHFPKLFGRGSTAELRKLLLRIASGEQALSTIKAAIDVSLFHDNAMPTVNQWKSIEGSEILEMGSWELLLTFMGAEKARKSYHLSRDQIIFRRTYGGLNTPF